MWYQINPPALCCCFQSAFNVPWRPVGPMLLYDNMGPFSCIEPSSCNRLPLNIRTISWQTDQWTFQTVLRCTFLDLVVWHVKRPCEALKKCYINSQILAYVHTECVNLWCYLNVTANWLSADPSLKVFCWEPHTSSSLHWHPPSRLSLCCLFLTSVQFIIPTLACLSISMCIPLAFIPWHVWSFMIFYYQILPQFFCSSSSQMPAICLCLCWIASMFHFRKTYWMSVYIIICSVIVYCIHL